MSALPVSALSPSVAQSDAPAAGLKRFTVRLTELDIWEIRIDAADAQTAQAFARDHFTSSLIAKADFDHVDGGIDYIEAEDLPLRGGAA